MAKLENVEKRLEALEAEMRRVRALKAKANQKKRKVLREHEKRRVWIVGQCALAAMTDETVRKRIAKELAKPGVLRDDGIDPGIFADLLAASYVPTAAEIEERRTMEMEASAKPAGAEHAAPVEPDELAAE